MRRAVVTIEWDGPDRPVREMIEAALDRLFEESLSAHPKVGFATSSVEFTARVKA